MALNLPPASIIRVGAESARLVHDALTRVIAGHPGALTTYTFYEEIDGWLGPWGDEGYPIGYGKFYNVAFSSNAKLAAHPTASAWVWRTTISLQEALREFIVEFVRTQPLLGLTEARLREAAFASHPEAYDRGGLATLALVAPELLPVIAAIPGAEFDPRSRDFGATVAQVFRTLGIVIPRMTGSVLAALAGPAHTGAFRVAAARDRQALLDQVRIPEQLGRLRQAIESGRMDSPPLLNRVIADLNRTEYPNQALAAVAREVIGAAEARKQRVGRDLTRLLEASPDVRRDVQRMFPQYVEP